jgi:hypothetical protein
MADSNRQLVADAGAAWEHGGFKPFLDTDLVRQALDG